MTKENIITCPCCLNEYEEESLAYENVKTRPEAIKELILCAQTVVKSPKHDLSDKIYDLQSALAKVKQ